jgi:hypothetical protein
MWGSYPASLQNVGGSTQVPVRAWNNARKATWGLPPPVKLERRDMTNTVSMWRKTQNKQTKTTTLQNSVQNTTEVRVSTEIILNKLHDAGMRTRRLAIYVPMTHNHNQARLQWVRGYILWTLNEFNSVLFTDESMCCIYFTDIRVRVWRTTNERFSPVCGARLWFGRQGPECREYQTAHRRQRHTDGSTSMRSLMYKCVHTLVQLTQVSFNGRQC